MPTYLADVSLRIIIAAALVGLVLNALRVRSGAARHAAWSAVLVAMLTMPALVAIVPQVVVPVPSSLALDLGTTPPDEMLFSISPVPPPPSAQLESAPPPEFVATPRAYPGASRMAGFDWWTAVLVAYAAGVLFFLARLAGGWSLARRLVRGASPLPLANRWPVLETAVVSTPLTTGVLAPVVVLLSLIHISDPRDRSLSRMPSSA